MTKPTEPINDYILAKSVPDESDKLVYIKAIKLMELGDYTAAISILQGLCKKFPLNMGFLKAFASCLQNLENYKSAIAAYKVIYLLAPKGNEDCLYFSGVCYYKHGDLVNAKLCFDDFLKTNNGEDFYKKRADLYIKKCLAGIEEKKG